MAKRPVRGGSTQRRGVRSRSPAEGARVGPESPADLAGQIERLDQQILQQVNERTRLAQRFAQARQQGSLPPVDLDAEVQATDALLERNSGPLHDHCVRALFRELTAGARLLVHPVRVAYLGPAFSYSHLAAIERFGTSNELLPVATIAAVFEEVAQGNADFGLVPIENSTDGRIVDTLEMFVRMPLRICAEVQMRIHHNLLGRGSRTDVCEVYSKPQALSQCRLWLARHLPAARTVETASTTEAAQLAAEKRGVAAIASLQAGVCYGLEVMAANIEDQKDNVTRFAVIGSQPAPRTGNDKTSLMFELPHQPGALADAMAIFKRGRLNLTWIESFPKPGCPQEYLFFVELEGHQAEVRVRRAIASLGRKAVRVEPLGSYARTRPVG